MHLDDNSIKCHSLIFNADMTLFEMSLLWHLDINQYIITCHKCHKHDSRLIIKLKKLFGFTRNYQT